MYDSRHVLAKMSPEEYIKMSIIIFVLIFIQCEIEKSILNQINLN